ncbi:hypothetical protein AB0395_00800 [Streptosporangium sp. NPDC051023]|uniref:hypothetical protein n=1 Tax=Streptosporangium sp. NPDC051023 TaxID=3155410 RepID=UPI00344EFA6C
MSGFTFELGAEKIPRAARKKGTTSVLAGTAGPYGEVIVTLELAPSQATLSAPGLPDASASHPDDLRNELLPVDQRTRLSVGGFTAVLGQNRRALRKEDRGLDIKLGDRNYTYLIPPDGGEELRDRERGPLVRQHTDFKTGNTVVVVQPVADTTDLALDLILQVTDRSGLTVLRTAVVGVWTFLNSGEGNR